MRGHYGVSVRPEAPGSRVFTLFRFLLSLLLLAGEDAVGTQCTGPELSLQSSLQGSARPWGSPSRHHQAMPLHQAFPFKVLAQGLAEEYGHMEG